MSVLFVLKATSKILFYSTSLSTKFTEVNQKCLPAIHFLSNFSPVIVKDFQNLTNWKNAFFDHPVPYLTDKGFPNPPCLSEDGTSGMAARGWPLVRRNATMAETYVIGESNDCMRENNTDMYCNGPLKPNTVYVWVHYTDNNLKTVIHL